MLIKFNKNPSAALAHTFYHAVSPAQSCLYLVIPEKIQTQRGAAREFSWGSSLPSSSPLCIALCTKKLPGILKFIILPLEIPEKTSLYLWKFYITV